MCPRWWGGTPGWRDHLLPVLPLIWEGLQGRGTSRLQRQGTGVEGCFLQVRLLSAQIWCTWGQAHVVPRPLPVGPGPQLIQFDQHGPQAGEQ